MLEEREKKKLTIPENTSDRDDFIQGIGRKEISILLIIIFAMLIFTVILIGMTQNIPACILTAFFVIGVTFISIKRDIMNENLIDKLQIFFRYLQMQKLYEYKQYIYEDKDKEKKK